MGTTNHNENASPQRKAVKTGQVSPRRFLWVVGLLLTLCAAPVALAQTTGSATLRGTVKDPNGAVVANATVTLVSERTGEERRITTGGEGSYAFASLDPGAYTLRVEASGFKSQEQTKIGRASCRERV